MVGKKDNNKGDNELKQVVLKLSDVGLYVSDMEIQLLMSVEDFEYFDKLDDEQKVLTVLSYGDILTDAQQEVTGYIVDSIDDRLVTVDDLLKESDLDPEEDELLNKALERKGISREDYEWASDLLDEVDLSIMELEHELQEDAIERELTKLRDMGYDLPDISDVEAWDSMDDSVLDEVMSAMVDLQELKELEELTDGMDDVSFDDMDLKGMDFSDFFDLDEEDLDGK